MCTHLLDVFLSFETAYIFSPMCLMHEHRFAQNNSQLTYDYLFHSERILGFILAQFFVEVGGATLFGFVVSSKTRHPPI